MLLILWLLCAHNLLSSHKGSHHPKFGVHKFIDSFIFFILLPQMYSLLWLAVLGQHYVYENHPYSLYKPSSFLLLYYNLFYTIYCQIILQSDISYILLVMFKRDKLFKVRISVPSIFIAETNPVYLLKIYFVN